MSLPMRHVLRFLLCMAVAALSALLIAEFAFRALQGQTRVQPQRVELVIPAGAAAAVELGEAPPGIPADMVFVSGDELVVVNQDVIAHQLGPIWVPPASTASMTLDTPNLYSMACTFSPSRVFDLDVRKPLTAWVRFQGVIAIALPSGVLLWLYSLVVRPVKAPALEPKA